MTYGHRNFFTVAGLRAANVDDSLRVIFLTKLDKSSTVLRSLDGSTIDMISSLDWQSKPASV